MSTMPSLKTIEEAERILRETIRQSDEERSVEREKQRAAVHKLIDSCASVARAGRTSRSGSMRAVRPEEHPVAEPTGDLTAKYTALKSVI